VHYRLVAPSGQVLDEGDGTTAITDGAVVVTPQMGQPIRVRPVDIAEISEPQPYVVRLRLNEGPSLDLSMLGNMRTQLMAQIGDVRTDDSVSELLLAGIGKPEKFPGAVNDVTAEVRLYDDALVTIPQSGPPNQVPYSFIQDVITDASGYRITVTVVGDAPVVVTRMAQRTSEFIDLLRRRVGDARGRTAAFLGALLPGLGTLGQRTVAATLRDGVAGAKRDLDAVDTTVWQSLVDAAALPNRVPRVATIAQLGDAYIGFKQWVTVEEDAKGVSGWPDPSKEPNMDHGGGPSMPGGLGGALTAGVLMGGPPQIGGAGGFGANFGGPMGGMLALGMLGGMGRMGGGMMGGGMMGGGMMGGGMMGGGMMGGGQFAAQHTIQKRDDVHHRTLTPASTDYDALSAQPQEGAELPTVLGFCMALTPSGKLVYEVLNVGNHATYVYNCPDLASMQALNRALTLIRFHVEAIYQDAAAAGSKWRTAVERLPYLQNLRTSLVGRAIHVDDWESQLQKLL
jgi:hypothetical protein